MTLGWISSSILGAFYIVAPLALGMPFRPDLKDRVWFGAYAVGTSGIVACFWIGQYRGMAWLALLVAGALSHVAVRAWAGLPRSPAPWPVKAHIFLSFANEKRPAPAALPRPDWATWQTHVAFSWLIVAAASGVLLVLPLPLAWMIPLGWIYGVAGLIGFLAQVVVGIQGRLLPMHVVPPVAGCGR